MRSSPLISSPRKALEIFRKQEVDFLIATDVVARERKEKRNGRPALLNFKDDLFNRDHCHFGSSKMLFPCASMATPETGGWQREREPRG
ncbi:hypothetical protein COCNU_10G001650 [Cocos nucifera]|uniref:Uncharacterized protein n=1 Tax=Cocos nucifera TaxID=13894 RepID=A0A8K0N814_COCNU|nr:hypothetical protein COCNU_10G001650 [Cocos nucifera]